MYHLTFSIVLIGLWFLTGSAERVAVVQVFRHGQRTPVNFYPNDPYKDSEVWNGKSLGELTNTGKSQHLDLGKFTRNLYSDFLSEKYNRTEFRIETTDVDRTHMSAQVNVYGIFPASGDEVWHSSLNWQPIPIHPSDASIWSSTYYPLTCDIFLKLFTEVLNSDVYQNINKEYASTFEILSSNSGEKVTDIVGVMNIWDPLKSEDSLGLSLPEWTKDVYPEPLRTLTGYAFASSTYTTQMKRIVMGPFFNDLVEYFESMVKDPTSSPKLKLYSGHDTNVAALLNTLGAFDPPYPPAFASSIYFELDREGAEYYVKVFSKDGDDFKQITIQGCHLNCSFSDFKSKLDDVIVDVATRDKECLEGAVFLGDSTNYNNQYVTDLIKRLRSLRT
ncbi:prostatic acid phosphatase-like [Diorhabda sublineata]|uniref:prostatic acid phosphatase-like n=1 Tax=Diorhabda sublineata TaxID=1163346 RepID=UPI0024E10A7D|nr:prostatic acid phosphatase-like [Diorhabda sublineata]